MKLKLCGFKKIEDINFAFNAGVDFIGLNNISISKRYIHAGEILTLLSSLSEDRKAKIVPLLNYYDEDFVTELKTQAVVYIQSYLDDKDDRKLLDKGFKLIKPFQVANNDDLEEITKLDLSFYDYLLLDTKHEDALGGTGESFDWQLFTALKSCVDKELILAGGLHRSNIKEAIDKTSASFIDIASGVEDANANKSFSLIKEIVTLVKAH